MTPLRAWAAALPLLVGAGMSGEAAPRDAAALPVAARSEVVERIYREVEARYVLPEVGARMSAHLRERLAAGGYAGLASPRELAEQMQVDLREISKDRHLFVDYDPREVQELRAAAAGGDETPAGAELVEARRQNFGVREVGILDGNVGYLDLRDFEHPNLSAAKLAAAMELLADCDAVVVDLRSNGGGWATTTALLASYFFAPGKPVHFTDFHERVQDETTQSWTLPFVPGRTLAR